MSAAAATQFAQGLERQLRDRWGLVCSACCTAAVLVLHRPGVCCSPMLSPQCPWCLPLPRPFPPSPPPMLPCRCHTQPPFAAQLPAQRVVRLPRGRPALLAQPGPNPANDNSAVAVSFQVGLKAVQGQYQERAVPRAAHGSTGGCWPLVLPSLRRRPVSPQCLLSPSPLPSHPLPAPALLSHRAGGAGRHAPQRAGRAGDGNRKARRLPPAAHRGAAGVGAGMAACCACCARCGGCAGAGSLWSQAGVATRAPGAAGFPAATSPSVPPTGPCTCAPSSSSSRRGQLRPQRLCCLPWLVQRSMHTHTGAYAGCQCQAASASRQGARVAVWPHTAVPCVPPTHPSCSPPPTPPPTWSSASRPSCPW